MANIAKASPALTGIMIWVQAMMKYHELLKIVNPKRAKIAEMKEKLSVVRAGLEEKRDYDTFRVVEPKKKLVENMQKAQEKATAELQQQQPRA